ncbi:MAG TPA: hypothetical protein VGN05_15600 [Parvibaculum sp.]|jgi:hypothetical protein
MRHLVLAASVVAGFSLPACAGDASPAKGTAAFYDLYVQMKPRGIPDAKQRAEISPLVSSDLGKLLDAAAAADELHTKQTNNEEPPLFEGDLFTSLYEGATSYKLGACVTESDKAYCDVNLAYAEAGDAKPTTWTDKVALVHGPRGWLVDDVVFGGTWDFGQHGMMRGTLRQIAAYDGK